jgi:NADPH:quinone reductase-like Zn-dependent oxidoreductase
MLEGDSLFNRLLFSPAKVPILGCDTAGIVEAVGSAVTRFRPGHEVFGDLSGSGFGAFAEYACAPETALARKPAGMSFAQAAALPQAGMLALQGLHDARGLKAGERVLRNGAGGGVGTLGLQIAKTLGAEVTAVDRADKLEMLNALGADRVLNFEREDFTQEGPRYDLILDVKTNRPLAAYLRALNPGGRYVTMGGEMGWLLGIFLAAPLLRPFTTKRLRVVALRPNQDLDHLSGLFDAGKLRPVIDGTYSLSDAPAALTRFGSGQHHGKVVLAMNGMKASGLGA